MGSAEQVCTLVSTIHNMQLSIWVVITQKQHLPSPSARGPCTSLMPVACLMPLLAVAAFSNTASNHAGRSKSLAGSCHQLPMLLISCIKSFSTHILSWALEKCFREEQYLCLSQAAAVQSAGNVGEGACLLLLHQCSPTSCFNSNLPRIIMGHIRHQKDQHPPHTWMRVKGSEAERQAQMALCCDLL